MKIIIGEKYVWNSDLISLTMKRLIETELVEEVLLTGRSKTSLSKFNIEQMRKNGKFFFYPQQPRIEIHIKDSPCVYSSMVIVLFRNNAVGK